MNVTGGVSKQGNVRTHHTPSRHKGGGAQCVPGEPAREVEERLLVVVVGLGRDVVVLNVLLAVERDTVGLHLAVCDIHLVAHLCLPPGIEEVLLLVITNTKRL